MKRSAVKNILSLHPFLDDGKLTVATASSQATISPDQRNDQEPVGEMVQMWIGATDNGTGINKINTHPYLFSYLNSTDYTQLDLK